MKLYYVILGATPNGRNIEQHDVFFGIAESLEALIPSLKTFWSGTKIHIDCYQEVKFVHGFEVQIVQKSIEKSSESKLFFINLGGYKEGNFLEFHEQHLMVGNSMSEVIKKAKETEFYKTMGFKNAQSHIDDKHGVDIDDIFNIHDILPKEMKDKFSIVLKKSCQKNQENFTHIGYLKI